MSSQLALALDAVERVEAAPAVELVETLPEEPSDPLDLVAPKDVRDTFDFAFRAMEWAEEAIQGASEAHPDRAGLLDKTFVALRPRPDLFKGRGKEHVVRAHMDELLARVVEQGRDADLSPGTSAEGVVVLSHLSLNAPLKHRYFVAAAVFFLDAFGPETATATLGEEMVRRADMDRDQDIIADILREVRHQVRDEERQKAWKGAVA